MNSKNIFALFPDININEKTKSYFENVSIERINLYTQEKKIDIVLEASNLLPKDIIMNLKEQIKLNYDIPFLDIKIKYTNIEGSTEEIISTYWPNIISYINEIAPFCRGILNNSNWELSENKLKIYLQSYGAEVLKSKECDKEIQNLFSEEFEINLKVDFVDPTFSEQDRKSYEQHKKIEETKAIEKTLNSSQNNKKQDTSKKQAKNNEQNNIILGKTFKGEISDIFGLSDQSGKVIIEGDIIKVESTETKSGKILGMFDVTDYESSITCKFFTDKNNFDTISEKLKSGIRTRVQGEVIFDKYSKEFVLMTRNIMQVESKLRMDTSEQKRVELHAHTKMSAMDSVVSSEDLIKTAAKWGHNSVAITDHGVVQAFPEAADAAKKHDMKVIYGVECYLLDDKAPIVLNSNNTKLSNTFVVFDIETTGLYSETDKITEIGAVKVKNGQIVDEFNTFVNPEVPIPQNISQLTGITDDMVKDAPTIEQILPDFLEFVGEGVFVAHNANFDMGFIRHNARKLSMEIKNPVLDTLELSRALFPDLKKHKLNIICEHLGIKLENHHRAVDDAKATAHVFIKFIDILKEKEIFTLNDINTELKGTKHFSKMNSYHAVILAKNYTGLRNLYKLISESHLKYFYKKPRIPKSLYTQYKEGLLIGTACEAGELYKAILENKQDSEIKNIVRFYDYLEIQPLDNNKFLLDIGKVESLDTLKDINKKIVQLGEKFKKPVVATCDVHYLNPEDDLFRRILLKGQGFKDADNELSLYFRTTQEMLEEFSYLGKHKAHEVVVKNTNKVSDMIEEISPISSEKCPPKIEGAEEELRKITYEKAISIYGENLPEIVEQRLEKELSSIIGNGYAVMYIIAQKLVWKSLEDGYLVGSRGSVGSSFAATMSGITEVNPLPAHYICPNCRYSEFYTDGSYGSGYDLPHKDCPECGTELYGEGQDIPFEIFLGFEGNKEPDIDLNFSGEYQSRAHDYTEELFGKGHAYRAGTIGTLADKTAYGFVRKYLDEKDIVVNNAEINRLVKGCTGVKRTTGQHPGGIIVLPSDREIYDFCPIQWPANDNTAPLETTHFDYHSIEKNLLKLDILGHDDPTVIKMLEDLTGVDAQQITLGDTEVMKLFYSTEVMNVTSEEINSEVASFGIPEFGTRFVRQMLVDTKPTTFAELVRISGLSHGTDVWLNNAQDLVREGTAELSEVISTRDDIMIYLIQKGVPHNSAFKIMEKVRKGKGVTEEEEELMKQNNVPDWYINSCKKIKYMFPKAHAAAYVMMAFRIAYFKLYYPEAFYSTYFSVRADDFDASIITGGAKKVKAKIKELEQKGTAISAKEKSVLTILEVANEMYSRGLNFLSVDIYKSDSQKFIITPEGILPSLNALPGLGLSAAQNIVKAREKGEFLSKEDLRTRAKLSKTVIELLEDNGCLKGLPESNQLSLFG